MRTEKAESTRKIRKEPPADAEWGLIERREYENLKRRALKFERTNRKCILIIPCDGNGGWCEMGENSALIYKYQICEKLGVPVTLADDSDSFYIQYEVGRIRTRGFEVPRRRLKKLGMYKSEDVREKCIIFELTRSFSEKELMEMREKEKMRQAQINSIVKVNFVDPVLYQKMTEVAARLHRICFRRLDKLSSATNGRRMVTLADNLIRSYYSMTMLKMTTKDRVKILQEMVEGTRQLLVELQIAASLKLWRRETCVKIGEEVLELSKKIEDNLKNETKRLGK